MTPIEIWVLALVIFILAIVVGRQMRQRRTPRYANEHQMVVVKYVAWCVTHDAEIGYKGYCWRLHSVGGEDQECSAERLILCRDLSVEVEMRRLRMTEGLEG